MRYIIDLETDGFLQECTKIHCVGLRDLDSDFHRLYMPYEINELIEFLEENRNNGTEYITHNGYVFDFQVIKKLYGLDIPASNKVHDTMVLSQLFYGDLKSLDYGHFTVPIKYLGSHSLAAWGHRILVYKGEYTGGFEEYNDEMGGYCLQDTEVTKKLFMFFEEHKDERISRDDCIDLEYDAAKVLARQQAFGVEFDEHNASMLEATLQAEKVRIRQELQLLFKPRVISLGEVTPKVGSSKFFTTKGRTYTKIKFEEYNPGSRKQTIDRLCKEMGWEPSEFTEKGNPELDEEVIESLPFKEIEPLKNYFIVDKRLGQLANGKKAWLKTVKPDGRIYGSIMQSGTLTGRMAHHSPNMAQVPSNDKLYGKDCRSLFKVPTGKVMIGVDADALEMRTLAGFLNTIDRGEFRETLLKGRKEDGTDMHSLNAQAYEVDVYENGRDCAKTLFYAGLYGAKNPKLGLILQQFGIDFENYVEDFGDEFEGVKAWSIKKQTGFSDKYLECLLAGKTARERYGKKLPHLPLLVKSIVDKWKERGYLIGLDGRNLYPRSEHAAFNTLNQSAGAIIMKKALVIADEQLRKQFVPGKDYEFILNVHDEFQLEVVDDESTIRYIRDILENSIKEAGEFFKFPCPMKGNSTVGLTWAQTH